MFISRVVKTCSNWWLYLSTKQETQDYIARLERAVDELITDLYFAKYETERAFEQLEAEREDKEKEREKLKHELDRKQDLLEEYKRADQEREAREEEDEQEHYRSYCPQCGSRKRFGRCPVCDKTFGRN